MKKLIKDLYYKLAMQYQPSEVFANLMPFLNNPAPLNPQWQACPQFLEMASQIDILVVGAGGLGCEIVKNLALSGIRNIHLVDMDTVDFTNLNRQFMFRTKDIGAFKADVVSSFVKERCPGVQIVTHKKKLQQMPFSFFKKFPVVIGGLDNIQARKYLNNIAFQLNDNHEEEGTVCYYIDGATEGFEGQALVVEPFKTSCYECTLFEGLSSQPKVNYCTIANTPRTPEHCIQYVLEILWEEERKAEKRDNDNMEHMQWIFQKSLERAKQFNIEGVTEMLTLGVSKNIIPAIASTNALIASVCTLEVFKILSGSNPKLDNYMLYKGGTSIGCETYPNNKRENCRACLSKINKLEKLLLSMKSQDTMMDVIVEITKKHEFVSRPFVNFNGSIFMNPGDTTRYEQKLQKSLQETFKEKNSILLYLTDKSLKDELTVELSYE